MALRAVRTLGYCLRSYEWVEVDDGEHVAGDSEWCLVGLRALRVLGGWISHSSDSSDTSERVKSSETELSEGAVTRDGRLLGYGVLM